MNKNYLNEHGYFLSNIIITVVTCVIKLYFNKIYNMFYIANY